MQRFSGWHLAFYSYLVGASLLLFLLYTLVLGRSPAVAALQIGVLVPTSAVTFALISLWQRRTVRRLLAEGRFRCDLRRPQASKGDRYRKWQGVIVTPSPGMLSVQPVFGRTSIAIKEVFELRLSAPPGARYEATRWDKFNRLTRGSVVMPLQMTDGLLEIAGSNSVLDDIEARLAPEPLDRFRNHHL